MKKLLPRLDIAVNFVDGRDLDALASALEGARLLYLESPTSVVFDVHDLAAQADLARHRGATANLRQ
jgi:cystathionine beta-lyase/cystathionine gamma-synthase